MRCKYYESCCLRIISPRLHYSHCEAKITNLAKHQQCILTLLDTLGRREIGQGKGILPEREFIT